MTEEGGVSTANGKTHLEQVPAEMIALIYRTGRRVDRIKRLRQWTIDFQLFCWIGWHLFFWTITTLLLLSLNFEG